jgi:hypothetical protein
VKRLATWLWGTSPQQTEYRLISALFLRLLALIYLVAFVSIAMQIVGLVGSDGILPFVDELRRAEQDQGLQRYWFYPTVFWIEASDAALQAVAASGCVLAVLLFLRIWQRLCLVLLFVLYLSLFHAGWPFMNFQWDYLLLEAGFIAIFLPGGSRIIIWMFRWLLFRFRFLSGASKLLSQDPSWSGLTALNYYFETQPLPHPGSWVAHQLPDWMLRFGTGATLFIEIVVPFMIFLPRGPRLIAAWATIALQLLIIFTSNHNFVNFLTIALCLFLFDDRALSQVLPATVARWLKQAPTRAGIIAVRWRDAAMGVMAGCIVFASSFQIWEMFSSRPSPEPVATALEHLKPFHVVNKYHVFPVIKTERMEIVVEGSDDGEHWQPYPFKYKPGNVGRRPELVIPHQPRLDWMLWFAHMGQHPMMQTWLEGFLDALLRNSPSVLALLEANPFSERPPRYLRIEAYRYRFSDLQRLEDTGQWWTREYIGPYYPMPWRESTPRSKQ